MHFNLQLSKVNPNKRRIGRNRIEVQHSIYFSIFAPQLLRREKSIILSLLKSLHWKNGPATLQWLWLSAFLDWMSHSLWELLWFSVKISKYLLKLCHFLHTHNSFFAVDINICALPLKASICLLFTVVIFHFSFQSQTQNYLQANGFYSTVISEGSTDLW